MCLWFGKGVADVSDDSGFRCAWGCSCARIGTFGAIGLYITSGKGLYWAYPIVASYAVFVFRSFDVSEEQL